MGRYWGVVLGALLGGSTRSCYNTVHSVCGGSVGNNKSHL